MLGMAQAKRPVTYQMGSPERPVTTFQVRSCEVLARCHLASGSVRNKAFDLVLVAQPHTDFLGRIQARLCRLFAVDLRNDERFLL